MISSKKLFGSVGLHDESKYNHNLNLHFYAISCLCDDDSEMCCIKTDAPNFSISCLLVCVTPGDKLCTGRGGQDIDVKKSNVHERQRSKML